MGRGIMLSFLFMTAGYLMGSVLFGYILPKYFINMNIEEVSEDHNPGTANVMKYAGVPCENPLMEGGKFRWGNSAKAFRPEDDFKEGNRFNDVALDNRHYVYPSGEDSFYLDHTEMPGGFRYNEKSYTARFYDNLWPAKYSD